MIRRRCIKRGHQWAMFPDPGMVEYCARWFCPAARTAQWVYEAHPLLAETMDRVLVRMEHGTGRDPD